MVTNQVTLFSYSIQKQKTDVTIPNIIAVCSTLSTTITDPLRGSHLRYISPHAALTGARLHGVHHNKPSPTAAERGDLYHILQFIHLSLIIPGTLSYLAILFSIIGVK